MSNDRFGYNSKIPQDIREIFMWLCQDLAALNAKWELYHDLYSSSETTDLLSDIARATFQSIEESLRNEMTMAISRLGDPVKSVAKETLSLNALRDPCSGIPNIDTLLDEFLDACKPVRDLRNRRVAHNDRNTRLDPVANPLPGIGQRQIETILELAASILNTIYRHYTNGELMFTPLAVGTGKDLVFWLKEAKKNDKRRP